MYRSLFGHARAVAGVLLLLLVLSAPAIGDNRAIVVKQGSRDFGATVKRLTSAIEARGAKIAAVVDHAAAAQANGLSLGPTTLVIFGNPKLGTPLMQSQRTAGLDLPFARTGLGRCGWRCPGRLLGAQPNGR